MNREGNELQADQKGSKLTDIVACERSKLGQEAQN